MEPLPGLKILIEGRPGSGKTTSIKTLAASGVTCFHLFTERHQSRVAGTPNLHWKYVAPVTSSWKDLVDSATRINTLSNKALQDLSGINRGSCTQWIDLLGAMNDFKCDCCNQSWGDVASWGPDKAIIHDGLTGISKMSDRLTVGMKPLRTIVDWGVAMENIAGFIDTMCFGTKAWYILLAHMEVEKDEIAGALFWGLATLGRKLGPRIPIPFDAVLLAHRIGQNFYWSTDADRVEETKAWELPIARDIKQDFALLVNKWKALGGILPQVPIK